MIQILKNKQTMALQNRLLLYDSCAACIEAGQLGIGKEPHRTDEIENSAKREVQEEEVQGCHMCTLIFNVS